MKLTALHDGSLRPRPSNLGKEPSKRPDRVDAADIVPELTLVSNTKKDTKAPSS